MCVSGSVRVWLLSKEGSRRMDAELRSRLWDGEEKVSLGNRYTIKN